MSHVKQGRIWRAIRNSLGIQISIYFIAFALLIILYTYIFHLFYPLPGNKSITWASALLFVVQSMTTVGYGEILPFRYLHYAGAEEIVFEGDALIAVGNTGQLKKFIHRV
ncbi:MAG: ion channel [Methanoregula sp.]|nr:ion channel [Methanoregula sp.]